MTENKRYRVFKYIDCEKYGVSDDVAEYTLARFDNHFEAEGLCDLLNELAEENEQLKQAISDWKGSYDELYQDIKILEKENEQLKSFIKGNCIWCGAYLEPQYRDKFGGD